MKKYLTTTILTLLAALFIALPVYANDIRVTVNGEPVVFTGQTPVIVDGTTLVPVRGVFEHLGFDVQWNPDTRQVSLTRDGGEVLITIGSGMIIFDGFQQNSGAPSRFQQDSGVPAQIINGSTMLPLRVILENVGYELDWDGSTNTVLITQAVSAEELTSLFFPIFAVIERHNQSLVGNFDDLQMVIFDEEENLLTFLYPQGWWGRNAGGYRFYIGESDVEGFEYGGEWSGPIDGAWGFGGTTIRSFRDEITGDIYVEYAFFHEYIAIQSPEYLLGGRPYPN